MKAHLREKRDLFQQLLRKCREEAGLTQVELALKLNLPQSFISKYEIGERQLDVLELREVCKAMGIPLDTFIKRLEKILRD